MSWKQFCDLGNVPKWYQNVDTKTLKIPLNKEGDSYVRMANSFIENPRSLVLFGGPGRGKTHFTFSIIRGLLDSLTCQLHDLRFFRAKELDDKLLLESKQWGSSKGILDQIKDYQYLFLDDFGMERGTERTIREFYDLLDYRLYNMKTTILTTNLDESKMSEYYLERVYSRLKEFIWIEFDGPDLRGGNKI